TLQVGVGSDRLFYQLRIVGENDRIGQERNSVIAELAHAGKKLRQARQVLCRNRINQIGLYQLRHDRTVGQQDVERRIVPGGQRLRNCGGALTRLNIDLQSGSFFQRLYDVLLRETVVIAPIPVDVECDAVKPLGLGSKNGWSGKGNRGGGRKLEK